MPFAAAAAGAASNAEGYGDDHDRYASGNDGYYRAPEIQVKRVTQGGSVHPVSGSQASLEERKTPTVPVGAVGNNDLMGIMPSTPSAAVCQSPSMRKLEEDLAKEEGHAQQLRALLTDSSGHWLVENVIFKSTVTLLVLVNAILMGVEVDYPEWGNTWKAIDHVFGAAFTIEMLLKWACLRMGYWKDRWNWLDCALAIMGFMDTWFITIIGGSNLGLQQFSILRVLRLLRLVRLARLFRQFSKLVIVMRSILDAIETTFWVASVLIICIYVCAIFCVDFIGNAEEGTYPGYAKEWVEIDEQEIMMNFNPYIVFGSMSTAMVSLFNIAILAEWTEIVRPVLLKQPPMVLFFIFFSIFVCFGVMNVIIGMIVDSVIQNARQLEREIEDIRRKEKVEILQVLKDVIFHVDESGDYNIDIQELDKLLFVEDPRIANIMSKVSLPYGCTADEFLALLDNDGDGRLQHDEFVQSLYRLINCGGFQQTCLIQIGVNKLMYQLNCVTATLNTMGQQITQLSQSSPSGAGVPPVSGAGSKKAEEDEYGPVVSSDVASFDNRLRVESFNAPSSPASASSEKRPQLATCLDTVCQEVVKALHSKLREELTMGIERVLAVDPKATHVDEARLTGPWEAMEDKLRKLDAPAPQNQRPAVAPLSTPQSTDGIEVMPIPPESGSATVYPLNAPAENDGPMDSPLSIWSQSDQVGAGNSRSHSKEQVDKLSGDRGTHGSAAANGNASHLRGLDVSR